MHILRLTTVASALCLAALSAFAGRLELGDPQVQGDKVTIPVMLTGDLGPGVSSIDFSMKYDPSILTPVNAGQGTAAAAADKQVHANSRADGDYKVVIVGLNQNNLENGEVASIVMQKVAGSGADSVNMRIVETTFASSDAVQIPSQGDSRTMNLSEGGGSDKGPEEDSGEEPMENDDPDGDDDPSSDDGSSDGDTGSGSDEPTGGQPTPAPTDTSVPPTFVNPQGTPRMASGAVGEDGTGSGSEAAGTGTGGTRPGMSTAVDQADAVRRTMTTPQQGGTPSNPDGAAGDSETAEPATADAMVIAQADGTVSENPGSANGAMAQSTPGSSADMVRMGGDESAAAGQGSPDSAMQSGSNSTVILVVAAVVIAGIIGLVVLRNRLFA